MKRVIAFVVVFVWALVAPPAMAQSGSSGWSPTSAQPLESAGEVVLRFTAVEAGRIVYYTSDSDCNRHPFTDSPAGTNPLEPGCGRPLARAGEDYVAVRGEWIFTEPGSRTIRVPILDDDIDEPEEPFGVHASTYDDAAEQLSVYTAVVRIIDDDVAPSGGSTAAPAPGNSTNSNSAAAAGPSTNTSPAGSQSSGSTVGNPTPTSPKAALPSTRLQMASPDGEFRPGPGFELTSEGAPEPAQRRGGAGGSGFALAIGSGTAALGVAALAVVRRRRRWSPTQA